MLCNVICIPAYIKENRAISRHLRNGKYYISSSVGGRFLNVVSKGNWDGNT